MQIAYVNKCPSIFILKVKRWGLESIKVTNFFNILPKFCLICFWFGFLLIIEKNNKECLPAYIDGLHFNHRLQNNVKLVLCDKSV